jgi:hypothetical protein
LNPGIVSPGFLGKFYSVAHENEKLVEMRLVPK